MWTQAQGSFCLRLSSCSLTTAYRCTMGQLWHRNYGPSPAPSAKNPGGQPSKCEPQPRSMQKARTPSHVLSEGHFGTSLRFLVLGFEVLELPPSTCETGLHTSWAGLRTCGAAPRGCRRRPFALPPPKAARSAAPPDCPKIGAYNCTSQWEHGCSRHGADELGSTATTRRVKEYTTTF